MSMQCKVSNILTLSEVHSMTPEEEDMEVMEDTKVMEIQKPRRRSRSIWPRLRTDHLL